MNQRIVFHVDFDYFYAQCEELRNPELKTKPVVVCVFSDRGGDSGAIATSNYLARKYGVKSGMPIIFAKKRLENVKDSVFLPADFDYYSEISQKAMDIMKQFSDIFEYVGRDEAFLDVTKRTGASFENGAHLAQQLKNEIRTSVKLSCTVGVSSNKLVSKIASDFKKPDGLTVVTPEKIEIFLDSLPIRSIPGIGKKTEEIFTKMGYQTIAELKKLDVFSLNSQFGRKIGTYLYNAIRGIDDELVAPRQEARQYSRITTLKEDSKEYEVLAREFENLAADIHRSIMAEKIMFKSVGIQFVQSNLSNKTKSKVLKNSTSSIDELKKSVLQLLRESLEDQKLLVRRIGVKVSDLSELSGQHDITKYF